MKITGWLAGLILTIAILTPATAFSSWVMIAEDQHSELARCPKGFQLISIEAGDADLLVCTPKSDFHSPSEAEQARLPSDEEGPLEGPKFN